MAQLYSGYAPSNVSRDAKYSIKHDVDGRMKVHLVYRVDHRDYALLSTDLHQGLVEDVNKVKRAVQGVEGGVFYINEYGHVLVKAADRGCYFAGVYPDLLEFPFDDEVISPAPPDDLRPSDDWPGPHVGIRYTLTADHTDIYYEQEIRPRYFRRTLLSEETSATGARALAHRLAQVKPPGGGRIYLNEAREFFAPVMSDGNLTYQYLGPLGDDAWFPEPRV